MSEENVEAAESNKNQNVENNPNKRKWRKKRKNFLSNAKKYVKKGQMGRGTQMPQELYQYFVGILEAIKQGIDDEEQKQALVNNVLERTKGEELNIIGNQLGCRVIELLLPYAKSEDLEHYIEVFTPDLRKLCSDNFSNYVLKALLIVCGQRATDHLQSEDDNKGLDTEDETPKKKKRKLNSNSKYTEEHIKTCHDFTVKISKYALNNLEDFVWDANANHILRTALKTLSGIALLPGEKPKVNLFKEPLLVYKGIPPHETKITYRNVPDDFKEIVTEFANRLSLWPQFKDLPFENMTSALLQVLLFAVKNADKTVTKNLIKKLLNESFVPDNWLEEVLDGKKEDDMEKNGESGTVASCLPPVFKSEPPVRLLEAALFVAKKKMYTQIYAKCFINRLGQLATMPMLNFTVQRLIDNCRIKEEIFSQRFTFFAFEDNSSKDTPMRKSELFEPIFEELCGKYEELLECGNTGVLVALAKACLRIGTKQERFVQCLEAALKCSDVTEPRQFAVSCLRLLPTPGAGHPVHVHGSIILQTVLDFRRPTKAVASLLALSGDELLAILCDAKGCHVADAFCKGQCVGAKSRDKLLKNLKGCYQRLALSRHGSRALERLVAAAPPAQRAAALAELAEKARLLNGTRYGRIVAARLELPAFGRSRAAGERARLESAPK